MKTKIRQDFLDTDDSVIQVTTAGGSSNSTQLPAGTNSIRTVFQRILDNIANIFNRMVTIDTDQTISGKKSFRSNTTSTGVDISSSNVQSRIYFTCSENVIGYTSLMSMYGEIVAINLNTPSNYYGFQISPGTIIASGTEKSFGISASKVYGDGTTDDLGTKNGKIVISDPSNSTQFIKADGSFATPAGGTTFTGTLQTSSTGQSKLPTAVSTNAAITLHDVARTGAYSDLTGLPSIDPTRLQMRPPTGDIHTWLDGAEMGMYFGSFGSQENQQDGKVSGTSWNYNGDVYGNGYFVITASPVTSPLNKYIKRCVNGVWSNWQHIGDGCNAAMLGGLSKDDFVKVSTPFLENVSPNYAPAGAYFFYHADCPTSDQHFYILTFVIDGSYAKTQIAFNYVFGTSVYVRGYHNSYGWQAWRNISDGGNADTLDGEHITNMIIRDQRGMGYFTADDKMLAGQCNYGFGYANDGFPVSGTFITFGGLSDNSYKTMIQGKYRVGDELWFRTKDDDISTNNPWYRLARADEIPNMSNYVQLDGNGKIPNNLIGGEYGTWIPSNNGVDIDSSNIFDCIYYIIGNVVYISGRFNITYSGSNIDIKGLPKICNRTKFFIGVLNDQIRYGIINKDTFNSIRFFGTLTMGIVYNCIIDTSYETL